MKSVAQYTDFRGVNTTAAVLEEHIHVQIYMYLQEVHLGS